MKGARCFATKFHSLADTVAAVSGPLLVASANVRRIGLRDSEFGRKSPLLGAYAAGILAIPRRFSAAQTSFHSVCALGSPRMLNCRNPSLLLSSRWTVPTAICVLRWASLVATDSNYPSKAAYGYRFEAPIAMSFLPSRQRATINFPGWPCGAVAHDIRVLVLDGRDRS